VASRDNRESLADWLIMIGAVVLFASLFLTWSHQFSSQFLGTFGSSELLDGVPGNPTAWQVYSTVDILLALFAAGLVLAALFGSRWWRVCALAGAAVALAFTLHALAVPPTDGANIFNPSLSVPEYASPGSTAGVGETVALAGLVLAIAGLAVSFSAD
jgi:hypothetical protein